MTKEQIKNALTQKGFRNWQKKYMSTDTWFVKEEIGEFKIYILLSNSVRVLIETNGGGAYCINLKQVSFSFKEVSGIDQIIKAFNLRLKAVKALEKVLEEEQSTILYR